MRPRISFMFPFRISVLPDGNSINKVSRTETKSVEEEYFEIFCCLTPRSGLYLM